MVPRRERGFALVAAVAGVAVLAYIAVQVLAVDRGGIALAGGRVGQARLAAAADAGIYMAIHGLASEDRAERWSIDGRPRDLEFDGVALTAKVEDERGKAPLAGLYETQARALFAGAGASGERLDRLVAEFVDWESEEVATPPAPPPAPQVRHGPMRSVGELAALPDMTPEIYARVAPAVTAFPEMTGGFDTSNASALAIATMQALGGESAESIDTQSQFVDERPVQQIAPDDHLFGRTLTVRVVARDQAGGRARRMAIVELTGGKARPFWIRYVE
jgi:general secretion pathway protein K